MDREQKMRKWKEEFMEEGCETVITWPESQEYLDIPLETQEEMGMRLVNDDLGLELFGGSAYIIPYEIIENLDMYLEG